MSIPPTSNNRRNAGRLRALPASTWIGVGITAFAGGITALSAGIWAMLFAVALLVMLTAAYGLIFRRSTWLRLPRKRSAAGFGVGAALAIMVCSALAGAAPHAPSPQSTPGALAASASPMTGNDTAQTSKKPHAEAPRQKTRATATSTPPTKTTARPTLSQTPSPVVTTKVVTVSVAIPFASRTVTSASLPKGTSSVTTPGVNGVETKTYLVTYTDGTQTNQVLKRDVISRQPVERVTTMGTYVAPAAPSCTNGTYVNSAGNTVCRPEVSSGAPSGATAKCADGTYSFSQSRRGTCSSHGGVAQWL